MEFAEELRTLKLSEANFLASFDVKSLFTQIPLDETVEICVNESDRLKLIPYGLTKKQFRSLLQLAVKESVFVFDNQLYQQVDGVAMGSPLGVLFANMYMAHVEERTFNSHPPPGMYARYVDDIFITTTSDEDASVGNVLLLTNDP